MKKITLLAAVIVATTFASCKKDRVCTCTTAVGSVKTETTYFKSRHKDARLACSLNSTESKTNGIANNDKTTCELK